LPVLSIPMDQDRRRHLRKAPESFAAVQIEGEEVGKVLNVSEGGLSFRSFAPVPQYGPLYFWFSFNLKDRIEGMGEVAWTDSSRKVGGLRFVQLPKSSREQIHTWVSRLPVQASGDGPPPRFVPKGPSDRIGTIEPDRVARFVAKARFHYRPVAVEEQEPGNEDVFSPDLVPPRSQYPRPSLEQYDRSQGDIFSPLLAPSPSSFPSSSLRIEDRANTDIPARTEAKPPSDYVSLYLNDGDPGSPSPFSPAAAGMASPVELVSFEQHLSVKKRQLVRGVLLGVCLSAAVAVGAVKYSNYRHRAAAATTAASTESSVSKTDSQPLPPVPPPASPVSPAADIFSSGRPNKGMVRKPAASKPLAASYPYSPSQQQSWEAKAPNQPARAPASPRASDPSSAARKKSMTPAQLWGAVQSGNTKAAVDLAEDYIQGEGVPKNCQQARVLLLMASEKRNAAAIKRLHELDQDKNTCP
jgi:PilZ domain-containing protein